MREWLDALEARTKKFSVGVVMPGALLEEAKELRAIFSRSRKTASERLKLKKSRKRKAPQLPHPAPVG